MVQANAAIWAFPTIDSTNLEAARRAAAGDFGPAWIVADTQTAGRGRRGKTWSSPTGNLFVTYHFAHHAPPAQLALLSFAAGLAVAETVDIWARDASSVRLKWPNDVRFAGAKLAGILLESGGAGAAGTWLAIGIGVNVAAAPAVTYPTTCLAALSRPDEPAPTASAVFDALRPRLERWAAPCLAGQFEVVRQAWLERAEGMGVIATISSGADKVRGRLRDLTPSGELEIEDEAEAVHRISAGEIYFDQESQD